MRTAVPLLATVILACAIAVAHGQQDDNAGPWQTYDTSNGEWRSYAGDIAGTKYSPLDQITAQNFSELEVVWEWTSVDTFLSKSMPGGGEWWAPLDAIVESLVAETPNLYRTGHAPNPSGFQATPLMVNGILYFNTPLSQGVAVDAVTGETIWVFNPKSYEEGTTTMTGTWRQRGVAYWTDGEEDERIFWGTGNGYLVCVDARSGQACADFGEEGMVDVMVGVPRANRNERDYLNAMLLGVHSPPIIVRDRVIHGSHVADRRITKEAVPGWVRAWDVRTGEHAWDFHTVPNGTDEYGVDTWLNESWRYSGNANVWSMLAGDNELGHVYLPTGTATNDYYGADRPGDNLFAETLIAVDVETGQRVWHFQAVHHGLWDYDFPTHPNLVDLRVAGRSGVTKAITQVSKQGFVYAFDRETGEPLWPIEERPVPQETNLPGEEPSPTQPFPTKPAPFDYQGLEIDDLVDFTPELRQMAVEAVRDYRLGPLFTPLDRAVEGGTKGTLMRPSPGGATGWGGAAMDPETGILYVPSRNRIGFISLYEPDPTSGATVLYTHGAPEAERMASLAAGSRAGPQMPQGLPLLKPPYSRITAIDMSTGENIWMTPTGAGDRYRRHRLLRDLDLPPLGGDNANNGPLLTKTLLIYCLTAGGTTGGPRMVAYAKDSGAELASVDLPSGAIGTPMTYMADGKQYIAMTMGGGPRLVAFALPGS